MALKNLKTSGPSAAPPVEADRIRRSPSRSFSARNTRRYASLWRSRRDADGDAFRNTASAYSYPTGRAHPYIVRLSQEASMTFTWTVEVMFSQIRGGKT